MPTREQYSHCKIFNRGHAACPLLQFKRLAGIITAGWTHARAVHVQCTHTHNYSGKWHTPFDMVLTRARRTRSEGEEIGQTRSSRVIMSNEDVSPPSFTYNGSCTPTHPTTPRMAPCLCFFPSCCHSDSSGTDSKQLADKKKKSNRCSHCAFTLEEIKTSFLFFRVPRAYDAILHLC